MIYTIELSYLECILFFLLIFVAGAYSNVFLSKHDEKKMNLDEVIALHKQINEEVLSVQIDTKCASSKVFQAMNGEFFLGGIPLKKLILTNEKVERGVQKVKGKLKPIDATLFEEALSILKREGSLVLSKNNNYEGLKESYQALVYRQMRSGVYFRISNKYNVTVGILAIEYQTDNPLFSDEEIMSLCHNSIMRINNLVNRKVNVQFLKKYE